MFDVEKIVKANCPDGYRIIDKTSTSHEMFFVGKQVETVRATETGETQVTVYVKNADGTLGDSTFPVYASMDEKALELALSKALSRFGECVNSAVRDYEPSVITRYILDVCVAFNRFYQDCKILGAEDESVKASRIELVRATNIVLGNAMPLICMKTPKKI